MAKSCNHYDRAFEQFLRLIRRPYVSVNETRRALFQDSSLKSMDFVVYSQQSANLLIDVKGRKLAPGRRSWESWTPAEDLASLMQWEQVFGDRFRGLLVFAYQLTEGHDLQQHSLFWELRGRRYAFYGVWARDYARMMRPRSARWRTVALRSRDFRAMCHPLLELL